MASATSDDTTSPPPRRKRHPVLWTSCALMLLLVASIAGWNRVSENRLKREVEALRRAGEPILPEDFAQPAVPDADNAVVDLDAAGSSIRYNDPGLEALSQLHPLPPLTAQELSVIGDVVKAHAAALANVDAAVAKPGIDWRLVFAVPVVNTMLPDLSSQRRVANLLGADLLLAHHQGDDARALRRAMQIEFISRAIHRQPFIVSQLIALGIANVASNRLMEVAPDLKIGGQGGATPGDIRMAIDALLAHDAEDAGVLLALRGERMMLLDAIQAVADGKIRPEFLLAVSGSGRTSGGIPAEAALKPMLSDNARFAVGYMTRVIEPIGHGMPADLPALHAIEPTLPSPHDLSIRYRLSAALLPSTSRLFEQHYRCLTSNRLAATALAIRWYRVDHDGKFPASLSELVPQYLPAVPSDPMAAGRPLGYARANTAEPIIYSVGVNGTDEGGNESPIKATRPDYSPWDALDVVVHLTPQPRKPDPDADDSPEQTPATGPTTSPAR